MKRLLFAVLRLWLITSRDITTQSTRGSIQGVWRVVEE
jgi:hypothetical protein